MRSTQSASNCRIHRPQLSSLIIISALCGLAAQQAAADFVFRAEANFGSPLPLHIYNTITDSWSIGANLPAGNTTQLASNGVSVFALPEDGNIYRYNQGANTWNFVQAGPAAAVGRQEISMFETHNGEFYWANDGDSVLHYTVGGVWNSVPTPRQVSSGSDVDTQNGQLYIRTYTALGGFVYDIASNTFPLIFDDSTSVGENSRVGGFYNGDFYSRTWFGNLIQIDPITNTPVDTGVPLATEHASMDISPAGLIYLNGYSGTETTFEVFNINTNTVTPLANAPSYGGNSHPTLAWVAVPEPSALVLMLLAGIAAVARRRRCSPV